MFTSTVVGPDGSASAAAVERAAALARVHSADLHVVGAYRSSVAPLVAAERMLDGVRRRVAPSGGPLTTHALGYDAATAILDVAAAVRADLIVVGNRGLQGPELVLGSVPDGSAVDRGRRPDRRGMPMTAPAPAGGGAATGPFDLDAYLRRIGVGGAPRADLATLRSIVAGQAEAIAFENLDPFLGRPVRLDPVSLQAKLVQRRRGGYCYEQNLLLTHALRALGFRTTGWAARVLWGRPDGAPPGARTHMLVRVDLAEGPHVVDVGFGGLTLTGVLRLEVDTEQPTPHEPFRLTADGGGFLMQAEVAGTWRALYRFDTSEQLQADYEVTSWYLSNHPESRFVTGLMIARPAADRRYALTGRELAVHHLGGGSERRALRSARELMEVLERDFLLDPSDVPGLEDGLGRLFR